MDNLEPQPGFYDKNGYGEVEKHFLHHATVSMLSIYINNSHVLYLSNFSKKKYRQNFYFKPIFCSFNDILNSLVFIGKRL